MITSLLDPFHADTTARLRVTSNHSNNKHISTTANERGDHDDTFCEVGVSGMKNADLVGSVGVGG